MQLMWWERWWLVPARLLDHVTRLLWPSSRLSHHDRHLPKRSWDDYCIPRDQRSSMSSSQKYSEINTIRAQRLYGLYNQHYILRWCSRDLPGLQISMIWVNTIVCMIHFLTAKKGVHQFRFFLSNMRTPKSMTKQGWYVLTLRSLLAAKNPLPPISLTVLTLTPKKCPWDLWRTTLMKTPEH